MDGPSYGKRNFFRKIYKDHMTKYKFLCTALSGMLFLISAASQPTAWAKADKSKDKRTSAEAAVKLPETKSISISKLSSYEKISITVKEDGKETNYKGVPLRKLFEEMMPSTKIGTMPEWKALSRKNLILQSTGRDGYPGLVTAVEMAMNASGDRFILATECDGKPIESGVNLICKMDEYHVRWVHDVVELRIIRL